MEHAARLVNPEPHEHLLSRAAPGRDHQQTLENFAQITKIERVMRLGRRRKELLRNASKHLHAGVHHRLQKGLELFLEVVQEPAENTRKDSLCALFARWWDIEQTEVTNESRRQFLSTPTRWSTSSADCNIFNVLPEQLLPVVEPTKVQELPQQLHRGLSSIRFPRGHIHIIHENHNLLSIRSSEPRLTLLLQLGLDQNLRLQRCRLRAEVQQNREQPLRLCLSLQRVYRDDTLSDSSLSGKQHRLVYLKIHLQQE
mmetsp:Transcript_27209/g.33035  ORF Transcript_27209/g.33035 Transcript_27209/m.33035 type:complete len:256 (-) Transcript_27209:419-1186(-)